MTGSISGLTTTSSPNRSLQASNDDGIGVNGFEGYFERSAHQNPVHEIPPCPPQVRSTTSMSKESQIVENEWVEF